MQGLQFEETVYNLEDHSLECPKSRTQIVETLSKPMSGILFGIILKTPALELC